VVVGVITVQLRERMCYSRKCPYPSLGRVFVLNPPTPLEIPVKGPLQYLFRPLLGKNEFAVTQHMYAFIGPNLDNIH